MTAAAMQPHGFATFCDDIRTEFNGKQIYLGVYFGQMLVGPSFPATLPTFAIIIQYRESRDDESGDDVTIRVSLPKQEQPLFETKITRQQMKAFPFIGDPAEIEGITETMLAATFQGLVIPSEGRIKVRAYRGDLEINLGSLIVKLNPNLQPTPGSPSPQTG